MDPHILEAQRYFPNYRLPLDRSEIGLREYDLAAKALEADNRSLTAASGIALFVGGAFATIVGSRDLTTLRGLVAQSGAEGLTVLAGSLLVVALLLIHYFARLQRSAVHAARKIVVLRRLLGLDYGNIESVLPADTLDGANEPFAIAMFPGWLSLQAIPALTVALVTGLAQFVTFKAFESGGSTIMQQLVRSNFLQKLHAPFRRKLVEWMLAPWLNKILDKREALDAYLVSVRFAGRAFGLAEGIRYFFPNQKLSNPLPAHRKFILIERLSNVTATFPQARIRKLVKSCKKKGLLCDADVVLLNAAYAKLGAAGKIDLAGLTPALDQED